MARVFAWIALRLTIALAVQDAPNPFDAPTTHEVAHRHRKHTHAESATCYGRRYPDLAYAFCRRRRSEKGGCDIHALHDHFRDHGRREGRRFGCEAPPLTAAETAKWKVHEARLRAKDEAQAARARARAGLDRVEKEDIVSAAPEPPTGPLGLADRLRDCRPDDVAARLHTECAGWNEKDPLERFTDEHRMKVLDEVIRAAARRRRLLGLS